MSILPEAQRGMEASPWLRRRRREVALAWALVCTQAWGQQDLSSPRLPLEAAAQPLRSWGWSESLALAVWVMLITVLLSLLALPVLLIAYALRPTRQRSRLWRSYWRLLVGCLLAGGTLTSAACIGWGWGGAGMVVGLLLLTGSGVLGRLLLSPGRRSKGDQGSLSEISQVPPDSLGN